MASGPYRFFVDENLLGIGKILARARRDVLHPGHPRLPEVPTGTLDPDWMPIVAQRDLVVISRDKRIRTKPVELAAFRSYALRVFWIAGKKDLGNWGNLVLLVRHWEQMERIIGSRGPGPWFQVLTATRISELPLPKAKHR